MYIFFKEVEFAGVLDLLYFFADGFADPFDGGDLFEGKMQRPSRILS
jgi:hypothetical protein